LLSQALIISAKPCDTRVDNLMLYFNELTVSLYLYLVIGITDYNEGVDTFEGLGIALFSLILVAFGVNLLKAVHNMYLSARTLFLKVRARVRARGKKR
jgi:hypothetical protein